MLAWARLSFAQNKSASSKWRVPQNHRPSLATSLKRGSRLGETYSRSKHNHPRLRELFNQNTQLHTISRLGESHSPKWDEPSPKPQNSLPERWPRADCTCVIEHGIDNAQPYYFHAFWPKFNKTVPKPHWLLGRFRPHYPLWIFRTPKILRKHSTPFIFKPH